MKKLILLIFVFVSVSGMATRILIPMNETQKNHIKAYGMAYWVLHHEVDVEWLLNYKGGSFLTPYSKDIENECVIRGVTYTVIPEAQATSIRVEIANPEINMEVVKLEKAPKIAVYSPCLLYTSPSPRD